MPDLNGSITKERLTKNGAILTVIRPHGSYELIREGSKITSAGYREAGTQPQKLRSAITEHQKSVQKKSERKKHSMWSKAESFLAAIKSKAFEGSVPLPVLDYRHQCCFGLTLKGERTNAPCPAMIRHGDHHYCKSCGCGEWKLARLDAPEDNPRASKLAYPDLSCPLGRFGPMPGERKAERNAD